MGRIPILRRVAAFLLPPCGKRSSSGINPPFSGLSRCQGQVGYALLTRLPVAEPDDCSPVVAPRLACVMPVASVHPEPGSNSSLYLISILFFVPSLGFPLYPGALIPGRL